MKRYMFVLVLAFFSINSTLAISANSSGNDNTICDFPGPVEVSYGYVCNGVVITWRAPLGTMPDGYNVYRKIGPVGDWIIRNPGPISDTTYIDNDIILGDGFQYCVTAVYGSNESEPVYTDTYYLPDPSTIDYLLVGTESTEWLNYWYKSILDSLGLEGEMVDHILPYCGDYLTDLPLLWLVSYPPRPHPPGGLCNRDIALMDYLDRGGNVFVDDLYLTFVDTLFTSFLFYDIATCIPYPFMGLDGVQGTFAEGLSYNLADTMWSSNVEPMLDPPEAGIVLEDNVECGCVDFYVDRQGYKAVVNTQAIHEFLDGPNGTRLQYFQKMMDFFGIPTSIEENDAPSLPEDYLVLKAYPNPFNAEVRLQVLSGIEGEFTLDIFDITGRKVRSFEVAGRSAQVVWDSRNQSGRKVASGMYFARITGPEQVSSIIKLTLLR
ncbi:MAG: T9SS type A sorting domain-containing protein [Candidatus Zixiibacteriota bacterium]|nr:MAG: T9SS type A sorting domain-containing protein [candidate division Zixibacteria bacterium]